MEFEKLKKKKFPTDRPIPENQGWVRGNKNIFKVGPAAELSALERLKIPYRLTMRKLMSPLFMPPTLKKWGGHIGFGLSVCMYVRMYVCMYAFMFEISS